jgi:hypothetical protein
MTKLKALASALVVGGAAFLSQSAMAADLSKADTPIDLSGGAAYFGQQYTGHNAGSIFSDRYTFTLTGSSMLTADLSSFSGNAKNGLDITNLSLFNANGLVLKGNQVSTGLVDVWTLASGTLTAGSYYLQIDGSVLSNAAGAYSAGATVTAVPEPATYGMMLGGLALVGAVAARRKSKQDDAA